MKANLTICVDTGDPRFWRLIDLIEELAADEHRGDAWEPPGPGPEPPAPARRNGTAGRADAEDEDAPTDGRQLLGWASKQNPDTKGAVIAYGKKKGLKSKIVDWSPKEVEAAYRAVLARQAQQWGGQPR